MPDTLILGAPVLRWVLRSTRSGWCSALKKAEHRSTPPSGCNQGFSSGESIMLLRSGVKA